MQGIFLTWCPAATCFFYMARTKAFDRESVLEKAVELFWRQGFNGTSMQDLVDALGINRSSIYDTFGDKRTLFLEAFARYRQRGHAGVAPFFEDAASIRSGFQNFFLSTISLSLNDPDRKGCFAVNCTTEAEIDDVEMHQILKENQSALEQIFTTYLDLAVRNNELPADTNTPRLAHYFFSLYSGMQVTSKLKPTTEQVEFNVELALRIFDGE